MRMLRGPKKIGARPFSAGPCSTVKTCLFPAGLLEERTDGRQTDRNPTGRAHASSACQRLLTRDKNRARNEMPIRSSPRWLLRSIYNYSINRVGSYYGVCNVHRRRRPPCLFDTCNGIQRMMSARGARGDDYSGRKRRKSSSSLRLA